MTRTLCAVLAALLAGALAAVPARAGQADMTIKIAGFPGGGTGFLITVAEKEGFFQKHGLRDVRPTYPEKDVEAFAYGAINAAFLGTLEVANLRNRNIDGTVIGPGVLAFNTIWAKKDKPYSTLTDLKGKKFGHFGWDSGTTSTLLALGKHLANLNVRDELQHVVVAPPATKAILDRGDVEAVVVPLGIDITMRQQGYKRVWGPLNKEWASRTGHPLYLAALAVRKEILDRPDVAKALVGAIVDAITYINTKPAEVMAKYQGYFKFDDAKRDMFVTYVQEGNMFDSRWDEKVIDAQWEFVTTAASIKAYLEKAPPGGKEALFRILR